MMVINGRSCVKGLTLSCSLVVEVITDETSACRLADDVVWHGLKLATYLTQWAAAIAWTCRMVQARGVRFVCQGLYRYQI